MRSLITIILLFFTEAICAQCRLVKDNYQLVFEENFNSISSIEELTDIWQFQHDDTGWGWGGNLVDTIADTVIYHGEYYDKSMVSILPGGILRLSASRLNTRKKVKSSWTLPSGYRYPIYKSGMIQLRKDLFFPPFDVNGGVSGFLYGMFEIRLKLPPNLECFPAFWLTRAGRETEIDIFEYGIHDREITNNLIDWSKPEGSRSCYQILKKSTLRNINEDFHVITCVWTPTKVTFFFDGRETRTVYSWQQKTYNSSPLSIVVNLAMHGYHSINSNYIDIDYIKVYKPKQGDYTVPYKKSYEFIGHNAVDESGGDYGVVNSEANSIAPNTSNPNEVFYRGSNNYIYNAKRSMEGEWSFLKIPFNDGAPMLAKGDVKYLPVHDMILYVGSNNRINLFGRSSSIGSGFYHWVLSSNWACYWCVSGDEISDSPGSLQTTPNGEVFYRGLDNKMHRYFYSGGKWNHQILASTYNPSAPADFVKGDIVIDPLGNSVFYKGFDDRIQMFYKNSYGIYVHGWVDSYLSPSSNKVNSRAGSMVWAPSLNGILYNSVDNKLHLYYWSGTWHHTIIPYTYSAPTLGYPGADLLNGSITWSNADNTLFYVGYDGRMQYFAKEGSTWKHYWLDDFWNTNLFWSFNNTEISKYSSADFSNGSLLFYTQKDGDLAYFKYESCEVFVECNDSINKREILKSYINPKLFNETPEIFNQELKVYPNPANNEIKISFGDNKGYFNVKIIDNLGKLMFSKLDLNFTESINIGNFPNGVYIVIIEIGENVHYTKFLKQ